MSYPSKKPASRPLIYGLFVGISLLYACSDETGSKVSRLDGDLTDCQNVQEICKETYPPQCFEYCADDLPIEEPPCPVAPPPGEVEPNGVPNGESDGTACPGEEDPCILLGDIDGNEVKLCGGDDCVVVYDIESGKESISCDNGGSGVPGGEPGDPGTAN